MARVRMVQIVEHLRSEMRRALTEAVQRVLPDAEFDERQLFLEFRRAVGRKCSTWERVPDGYVDCE